MGSFSSPQARHFGPSPGVGHDLGPPGLRWGSDTSLKPGRRGTESGWLSPGASARHQEQKRMGARRWERGNRSAAIGAGRWERGDGRGASGAMGGAICGSRCKDTTGGGPFHGTSKLNKVNISEDFNIWKEVRTQRVGRQRIKKTLKLGEWTKMLLFSGGDGV